MEVKKTAANNSKTSSTIDFSSDLDGLTKIQKSSLLEIIGELMVEQIQLSCADSTSPIEGKGKFKRLSKEYAEFKMDEVGSDDPNLDMSGEMLNELDFKITGDKLEIGVFGESAGKADGHNNFSGKSKLPTRQFLPKSGDKFAFQSIVDETINTFVADNITLDSNKLKDIDSKADLYKYLKDELGDLTHAEIRSLILRSELAIELQSAGLLDYL